VAYTIGTDFKAAQRPAPEDVVFWNSWGELKPAKGES